MPTRITLQGMAALPGQADDDRIAAEHAALRRVATLVARGAPPGDVFAAVAEEAVRLLHADFATMSRYDPEGSITVVAAWRSAAAGYPVGSRWSYGGSERADGRCSKPASRPGSTTSRPPPAP